MADHHFTETQIPQQINYNSVPFPSVLSPNPTATVPCSASLLVETIKTKKPFLDSLLHQTGAVLFRGFDIKTAEDFNNVVEAFGYEDLPYVGGTAPRTNVVGRVYTTNESPPDQNIGFHHEMAQAPESPSKLLFFCEVAPASGGETPIVLSHIVYERMRQKAAKLGIRLEWMEDGGVKRITGPIPAIRHDKSRQRKIWFTSMIGWEHAGNDPVNTITFGDGTPLSADICHDCLKFLEEECVAIPWLEGDVLLIDNFAVLHSRRPSKPPRRILASLCK